jgi:hypothetical protein
MNSCRQTTKVMCIVERWVCDWQRVTHVEIVDVKDNNGLFTQRLIETAAELLCFTYISAFRSVSIALVKPSYPRRYLVFVICGEIRREWERIQMTKIKRQFHSPVLIFDSPWMSRWVSLLSTTMISLAQYRKIVICACEVGAAVDRLEPIFSIDISINVIYIRQVILKLKM